MVACQDEQSFTLREAAHAAHHARASGGQTCGDRGGGAPLLRAGRLPPDVDAGYCRRSRSFRGCPYRYFASKEEIILTIAADAFRLIFEPMERVAVAADAPSLGDLVAASLQALSAENATDTAGQVVPVEELLQCVVQTWSELLRNDGLHTRALEGFERVRRSIADALRRGQAAGAVPTVEPESGARVLIGLLHGFLLQRVAFGLTDTAGFNDAVRGLLDGAERPDHTAR